MAFIVEHVRHRPGAKPSSHVTPAQGKRPMSRTEIADELAKVKWAARRLRPPESHDPERFHADKSELVRQVERLEDAIRGNRPLKTE